MNDTVEKTTTGAILYDSDIFNQISDAAFSPSAWSSALPVMGSLRSAGRGNAIILSEGSQEFVLRHYVRGGFVGQFVHDAYVWTGERQTRSFAEWYLLGKLRERGLPVPRPAAARYTRNGLFYRADLITERIPGICSLADRILNKAGDRLFWMGVGSGICSFHDAGVDHVDLNAYNVQIDLGDRVHLLDFDKGRIRAPGVWRQKNMARLHRSLQKIKGLDDRVHFNRQDWEYLLDGYFSASRSR